MTFLLESKKVCETGDAFKNIKDQHVYVCIKEQNITLMCVCVCVGGDTVGGGAKSTPGFSAQHTSRATIPQNNPR